jgi:hypothetical protein
MAGRRREPDAVRAEAVFFFFCGQLAQLKMR